VLNIIYYH